MLPKGNPLRERLAAWETAGAVSHHRGLGMGAGGAASQAIAPHPRPTPWDSRGKGMSGGAGLPDNSDPTLTPLKVELGLPDQGFGPPQKMYGGKGTLGTPLGVGMGILITLVRKLGLG